MDLNITRKFSGRRAQGRGQSSDRRYLLVIEGESSQIYPLPRRGEVLVGRHPEAEIRVKDGGASRAHARFVVSEAEISIVDLNSHNGTRVNGEEISKPRVLASGDVITICDATLVLRQDVLVEQPRNFCDEAHLRRRLAEELDRALEQQRQLVLMGLDCGTEPEPQAVAAVLSEHLRIVDVVASRGKNQVLVLMPELEEEEAADIAGSLLQRLLPVAQESKLGLVVCPTDGADPDTLLSAVLDVVAAAPAGQVTHAADAATTRQVGEHKIVVADTAMVRLYSLIEKLAQGTLPVQICGETGTGKELAASAIHYWSRRKEQRLVTLNCAALPEALVEGELFGYEKGAFSGATTAKAGLFESAHGGTVFLDEVGELTPAAQTKLLRTLETKRVMRLGGNKEQPSDFRIVAATNRNLEEEVKAGRFREDLFFRLSAATVMLLPLRDRTRELPILARTFLKEACRRAERAPMTISVGAMHQLLNYRWPGNLRELKNVMDYLAATVTEQVVLSWQLPARVGAPADTAPAAEVPAQEIPPPARTFRPLEEELRELERRRIVEALAATEGVQNRAAELLSMPLRTFANKVKLYGLSRRGNQTP